MIRPFLLAAFAWTLTAFAADDVALINHLAGDASYVSAGAKPAKAAPYMKLRDGDRFTLPAGAQLRLVYLKSGRQEAPPGDALHRRRRSSSVQAAPSRKSARCPQRSRSASPRRRS